MKLKIEIECDNAAFVPLPGVEVGRILREFVDDVLGTSRDELLWANGCQLLDVNGNVVGSVRVKR